MLTYTSGSVALVYDQPELRQANNIQPASIQPTQYRLPDSEVGSKGTGNDEPYIPPTINLSAFNASGIDVRDLYLGNNSDDAISRSAYAIDPNNASQDKIYPSDMVVKVQETRTGMVMLSVAVSSDSGLMGRFMIEEQNFDILNFPRGLRLQDWKNAFRGKGQRFRIEAMPGTDVSRYSASWETPYLFNLDYSFGVNGYYYQRFYDEWYEDRIGGSVSFGKLWTPDFLTSLTLSAQEVRIYNPAVYSVDLLDAVGRHPMYGIGINARHNTRDSEYRPTQGHLISCGIEQVLGDYQFLRGNIDIRKYFTLHERPDRSGRWVLGLRCSLDVSEKGTPIYERYFGGGHSNLRGFEYRGVSPRNQLGVVEGGCVEFYNSAELIFPITADDMVMGSVFIDTGTVERSMSKWEDDYRVSVGFGLYLTIPMMGPAPIALNFGFPINKNSLDEKQVFAFAMGWQR
jgi:outer membrane protein insertion porin family